MSAPGSVTASPVELDDGRVLELLVAGPESGMPLVFHSGTPSAAVPFAPMIEQAAARGLRLVTWSRPGYGASTRQPGRSVADIAADTEAIVDGLGGRRFLTMGWSGGGPHALACAALLPERTLACATIAGVAPWDAEGLDFLDGMGPKNIEEFGDALEGAAALEGYLEREAEPLATVTGGEVADAFGGLIGDVDRASLTGEFAEYVAASVRRAVSYGIWGWFDDDMAFVRDWGFQLGRIEVPVAVWQGDHDLMVPFAHGRWLAEHISGATPKLFGDEGHLSIAVGKLGEIMDELVATAEA
jgi:pimeloyl-ACP methyl ester carboxylesterase